MTAYRSEGQETGIAFSAIKVMIVAEDVLIGVDGGAGQSR